MATTYRLLSLRSSVGLGWIRALFVELFVSECFCIVCVVFYLSLFYLDSSSLVFLTFVCQ